MNAPAAALRRCVDEQARDRIQLVADVHADGPDRRVVAQPRPDVVAKIVQSQIRQLVAQTLPKSRKATAPSLPVRVLRNSVEASNIVNPPIDTPEFNGLTS